MNLEEQTDKQDETKSRLSVFCWHSWELAQNLKKLTKIFPSYRRLWCRIKTLTRSQLADKPVLFSDCHEFNFKVESQPLWISFVDILISFIITSVLFLSWHLEYITNYRILRALMSKVCIKWLQICRNERIQSTMQLVWFWMTYLPKHFSVQFAYYLCH